MIQPESAETFKAVQSAFDEAARIVLVGHVNADGDAIGSMAALHSRLAKRGKRSGGKQVTPFLFEAIPERFRFLNFDSILQIFDPDSEAHASTVLDADLIVILDLSVVHRMPGWDSLLDKFEGTIICIDHHPLPETLPGHINLVNPRACATGELLYKLFRLEGTPLTRDEALALFTAITTDTGWFQYTNTTPETLAMASELLSLGIEPADVFGKVYQANDFDSVRLTGKLAYETRSALDGRLLWVSISREALASCGLESFETESILDILRSVKTSLCVVLFRETTDGAIRVNLRSKGDVFIHKVAERFGGGGHRKAAGITLRDVSLEEAEARVIDALTDHLQVGGSADS